MFKAGAVLYAIFISFLVACLCSIFILLFHMNTNTLGSLLKQYTVSDNLNSALNYILDSDSYFRGEKELKLSLFEEVESDISIRKTYWGVYEKYYIQQESFPDTKKITLIGKTNKNIFPPAIYLTNKNEYLKLGGNSRITGNAYLPGSSVKYINVDGGNSFRQDEMIGNIYKSEKKMPQMNRELIQYVEHFLSYNIPKDNYKFINSSEISNLGINSFEAPTIVVKANDELVLDKISLKGNIVLSVSGTVVITPNANLDNIIIFAEEVIIENGFKGRLQIFVRNQINVGKNCFFKYPSILCCRGNNTQIMIEEKTVVAGGVIVLNYNEQSNNRSSIYINTDATIYGEIISNGYVCHEGILYGTMIANGIFSKSGNAILENTMLNGVIDATAMPLSLVRSLVIDQNMNKEVIDIL